MMTKNHKMKEEMQQSFLNDEEKIKTFVRIKPSESPECFNWNRDSTRRILNLYSDDRTFMNRYIFNRVFGPDDDNETIFSSMLPLLKSAVEGNNVCLIAYGASGSEKTHTMIEPTNNQA